MGNAELEGPEEAVRMSGEPGSLLCEGRIPPGTGIKRHHSMRPQWPPILSFQPTLICLHKVLYTTEKLNKLLFILLPKFQDQILKHPWAKGLNHPTYWFVMRKYPYGGVPGSLQQEGQGLSSSSPGLCVG